MGHEDLHELTSAYALDALSEPEAREYEQHLRDCPRCRDELTELTEVATNLAYAVPAPDPPPALRQRILDEVRRDGADVIPLRSRRPLWVATGLAAVAACAAIGLGLWAFSLQDSLDQEREARRVEERAVALMSDPETTRISLSGGRGVLLVGRDRTGLLVLEDVGPAPEGKDYEAWVALSGPPAPAGVFEGGDERIVELTRPVPEGARVLVTLEEEGGVDQPEGSLVLRSTA